MIPALQQRAGKHVVTQTREAETQPPPLENPYAGKRCAFRPITCLWTAITIVLGTAAIAGGTVDYWSEGSPDALANFLEVCAPFLSLGISALGPALLFVSFTFWIMSPKRHSRTTTDRRVASAISPALFLPGALIAFLGLFATYTATNQYRLARVRAAAARGQDIVEAIEAYKADKQRRPPALAALAPDYLDEIPSTGLRGCPAFDYSTNDCCCCRFKPPHYELRVTLTHSPGVFYLAYRPEGEYPAFDESHREIARIGTWCYSYQSFQ